MAENNIHIRIYKKLYAFYGPQRWWPAKTRLEIIVGAILTQNTAWNNVETAVKNLKKQRVLSINGLRKLNCTQLAKWIRSSGYYNIKAKRIKNFLTFLSESYQGSLDKMFREDFSVLRENLLSVNGLGPETVDSILLYAGDYPVFVVDAYTKRIFLRHNLIGPTDNYEAIQAEFMSRLEKDAQLFNEYHALIVQLGKSLCRKKPKCSECPLKDIELNKK
ncbi:MAG: endonuclease III domain-containing protein [Candidatus Omnitrophota bacterium]